MSTAVVVDNVTKKFIQPGRSRQGLKNRTSGKMNRGSLFIPGMVEILALDDVSFRVQEGEIFGISGAAGCGKTTLVRLLAALLQPDQGEIRIFGRDIQRQPMQVQRLINRVSVEASFFKRLSAFENLALGRLSGQSQVEFEKCAAEMLVRLGMDRAAVHLPMEALTRSMQQKVAIVRALLARPRLLLLDEPTRDLDKASICTLRELIDDLREDAGTTVLLTMRNVFEADRLCDRIAFMDGGRVSSLESSAGYEVSLSAARFVSPEASLVDP